MGMAVPRRQLENNHLGYQVPAGLGRQEVSMHGRGPLLLGTLMLLGVGGCSEDAHPDVQSTPTPPAAHDTSFDAATAGAIEGCVVWDGPPPTVPRFVVFSSPDNLPADGKLLSHVENPFAPVIDPKNKGVKDVVIFLRGVDPRRAGPWPHAPVQIEQRDRKLFVVQGDTRSRVGFVRRSDSIAARSCDDDYHALRARGAAFFTLPFVDEDRPATKRLDHAGVVELSSAAGYFWMHAHLFVVEHPCYIRTDANGRFRLGNVPAGTYEAVAWIPSWAVLRKERDPESGLVARAIFAPPVEKTASVTVQAGAESAMHIVLRTSDF
jgi:hypothetical protein